MSTSEDSADIAAAAATLVRVEKGHADAEELAAVTAVLLARAAATAGHHRTGASARPRRSAARWRRLERQSAFRAPHSWQG
ncbi:acyl-CoA carboxylase subunit epsilon [Streptomyces coffeae]|uniref:Acyl-CoA carboxylase subunit epsilon n=1 Tax=Streptomyces coffeae TaxID=621382 RepID=A0ABS1NN16_9ACTN|nr:acyl-CoA carboxylase subunit epsilon [Streptomyces coffeae]MBL1101477.1 acyl-CoA carboxylase subunit epsilon [Streptomyces coffeae]